jgi:hypothetical protein
VFLKVYKLFPGLFKYCLFGSPESIGNGAGPDGGIMGKFVYLSEKRDYFCFVKSKDWRYGLDEPNFRPQTICKDLQALAKLPDAHMARLDPLKWTPVHPLYDVVTTSSKLLLREGLDDILLTDCNCTPLAAKKLDEFEKMVRRRVGNCHPRKSGSILRAVNTEVSELKTANPQWVAPTIQYDHFDDARR